MKKYLHYIFIGALLLVSAGLIYMMSLASKEPVTTEVSPTPSIDAEILSQEDIVEDTEMHLALGISTYVSPLDASSVDEGKLQDGNVLVDTALAVLVLNGDDRIVYAYLDDIENDIWFDASGTIGNSRDIAEWPSRKDSDDDYVLACNDFEEGLKGMNHDEVMTYIASLNAEDYPLLELSEYSTAIDNAFNNLYPVSSLQYVGVDTLTRYELSDADEENNGQIDVLSTLAVVSFAESENITAAILDEVETSVDISNSGKVLNSRFDTRSKKEKSLNGSPEGGISVPAYYAQELASLEKMLVGKKADEIAALSEEEAFNDYHIIVNDMLALIQRAADNMIAWY